jgi:hypothetical protein
VLAVGLLAAAAPAGAQDFVRADCKPLIEAPPAADAVTARWYRRFWTGDCAQLKGCMSGSPNWNDIVGRLIARSQPAERTVVLAKACRLGPLIGEEWTRPKSVRRIDTGDLRKFKATLEGARDVVTGLDKVEAQARARIRLQGT